MLQFFWMDSKMILLLLIGLAVSIRGETDLKSLIPQQVHLSLSDKPNEVVITWSTMEKTADSFVEFGLTLPGLELQHGNMTYFEECGKEGCRSQYIHRVRLSNLTYGASYMYHVGSSDGGWSPVFSFKTPPSPPASEGGDSAAQWAPRILVLGDMGTLNAKSLPYLQEEVMHQSADGILHVGDFAYDMDWESGAVGDEFMRQIEPIAAYVPYMTCPGNHEEKRNFSEYRARFSMPGPYENLMHSFDMGMVHFIALSTEFYYFLEYGIKLPVMQFEWLVEDLKKATTAEARAARPWIVAFGHRPMYCSNGGPADCNHYSSRVRTGIPFLGLLGLENLFYEYGVDLLLWGHQHSYERLWPVYNHEVKNGSIEEPYRNPGAPVHIITGSAGCWEGKSPFVLPAPEWSAFRSTDFGYTRLLFQNVSHLLIEQVSVDKGGQVIDSFWIMKDEHRAYEYSVI
ncbi:acid phosphatase type 7-like isoform X1 [Schistocerca cancellata]|uniref:acid phosphatase type 7-like isoform X1 n=2 Tax=Schistocerca cancellata TaxID=274614 RepID=UPI0021174461|nr:acid phosphatase type 7-like isoform X1 [Schistocerca cancellata]